MASEMKDPRLVDRPSGPIVGLVQHKDRFFVATHEKVYELIDGIWYPMAFAAPAEPEANSQ